MAVATSVSDFLAQFQYGGLRPNRYQVVLTFPADVSAAMGSGTSVAQKISFTCKSANIPASSVGLVTVPYMGRQIKLAGDKTFDDWNVTVLLDNDLVGRHVFERWHDQILAFDANVATQNFVNPSNYFATATVQLLDRANQPLDTYVVEAMWPMAVSDIGLGYDQNDQVSEQQITFAVNGWSNSVTT
jgi:hypothetical protein